jgi:hypothetical protein
MCRDKSRPTKALTGQRTPKLLSLTKEADTSRCSPLLFCLLPTAFCLLFVGLVTRDRSGSYQPSMRLSALTAFFS